MKRTADNSPQSSRRERYGRFEEGSGGDAGGRVLQRQTMSEALSYVAEVEETFRDQPEKFDIFLDITKDFGTQSARAVARAKELFKGHETLIHGFNTFSPEGCKIALDEPPAKKQPATYEEAFGFINRVKEYFRSEIHIYVSFVNAILTYRRGRKINAVYNEVAVLFDGHPDLLKAFERFLPDGFQNEEELSSITTLTSCQMQMVRPIPKPRMKLNKDPPDLDHSEDMMKKVQKDDIGMQLDLI